MCQHNLPCSIVYAHCLLPGRAFTSLYVLLFLEKEAEIGGRGEQFKAKWGEPEIKGNIDEICYFVIWDKKKVNVIDGNMYPQSLGGPR